MRERDRFDGVTSWFGVVLFGRWKQGSFSSTGTWMPSAILIKCWLQRQLPFFKDTDLLRRSRITHVHKRLRWFATICFKVLDWPALSPYTNPIEHIWDELGKRVRKNPQLNDIYSLKAVIIQEWYNIPNAFVLRYVNSTQVLIRALKEPTMTKNDIKVIVSFLIHLWNIIGLSELVPDLTFVLSLNWYIFFYYFYPWLDRLTKWFQRDQEINNNEFLPICRKMNDLLNAKWKFIVSIRFMRKKKMINQL